MASPNKLVQLKGEAQLSGKKVLSAVVEVDAFAGKSHTERDQSAVFVPFVQFPFCIQLLKLGERSDPWVNVDCHSNNMLKKIDVFGSLFLYVSSEKRYASLLKSRCVALISTIFDRPREAVTSSSLLLSCVSRLIEYGRKKKWAITSSNGGRAKLKRVYQWLLAYFRKLKSVAPQLTIYEFWDRILVKTVKSLSWKRNLNNRVTLLLLLNVV